MINILPKHVKLENLRLAPHYELDALVKRSKDVMAEYGELFKSKTLEKLYTPEYHYTGCLPNSTYIIDKKTGKRKIMFISSKKIKDTPNCIQEEEYIGNTLGLKELGYKNFGTISKDGTKKITPGAMESKVNNRYAGTQIRLTQIEVERAMQIGEENIPLYSVAEALPFHTMMGFRPTKNYNIEIRSVSDVKKEMDLILKSNVFIDEKHFTPIVLEKDGKYYFDRNQTNANALLRQLKENKENGIKRDFHSIIPANSIVMNLSGTELEAWKQRALSQPILLKKSGKDR